MNKNKKYSLSLLIILIGILTNSLAVAESGAKKGSTTQQPVIKMPIMVPVKTNALDKKIPLVKAKPRKAIARQVKPLSVKQLGKGFGKGPTNVSGTNRTIPSSGGMSNVPADHLNHANQAGDLKEVPEVTRDRLGALNQENPLDSNLGLGPNDSDGYSFGGREGDNENSDNGPARAPIGTPSVSDIAGGATSQRGANHPGYGTTGNVGDLQYAPAGASTTTRTTGNGGTVYTDTWTSSSNGRRQEHELVTSGNEQSTTQVHRTRVGNRETKVVSTYDQAGHQTGRRTATRDIGSKDASSESKAGASKEVENTPKLDSNPDIHSGAGSEEWEEYAESINRIKKPAKRMPVYVNPGKEPETGSNSAPKATLFMPKDKLVTNPDPEHSREDGIAGRAMRPEKIMEGAGPGGHIGKGQ